MRGPLCIALAAVASGLAAFPGLAAADTRLPIPEQRIASGWKEAQRIRYANTPLLRKADDALRAGDAAAAEPLLRDVLANNPGDNRAQMLLARVCGQRENWAEAARLYEDMVAHYPGYLDALFGLSQAAGRLGRIERAADAGETFMRDAPLDDPRRREMIRLLAQWNLSLNRNEQAVHYGLAWAGFQAGSGPLQFLADCAISRRDWTGAVACCERLLAQQAGDASRGDILLQKGYALGQLGRRADANVALQEAESLVTGRAQRLAILRQLGFNSLGDQRTAEAARFFKSHLLQEFEPTIAQVYLDALDRSGQQELAAVETRALLARADLPPALRRQLEVRQGKNAAERSRPQADSPQPEKPRAEHTGAPDRPFPAELAEMRLLTLVRLGVEAFRAGQFASAADDFTRALQLDPERSGLLYLRGVACFKQGAFPQAEEDFQRFLQRAEQTGRISTRFWDDLGVSAEERRDFDLGPQAQK